MKFNKKLAATTTSVVLSIAAMEAKPAQATVLSFDFTVTGTSGSISNQQFFGSYSYDDSTTPNPFTGKYPLLSFNFDFQGRQYTVSDLFLDAADYGGSATGLLVIDSPVNESPSSIDFEFFNERFIANAPPRSPVGTGSVVYSQRTSPTSVPEPATLGGLGVLGLSSMFLKKKVGFKLSKN